MMSCTYGWITTWYIGRFADDSRHDRAWYFFWEATLVQVCIYLLIFLVVDDCPTVTLQRHGTPRVRWLG